MLSAYRILALLLSLQSPEAGDILGATIARRSVTKLLSTETKLLPELVPINCNRPLSRRLDRCDRVIQNESRDPFGGNVYYVTMQVTFITRKFRNEERNLHCDVVHITTKWVCSLTLGCNGVFAIKAYSLTR